MRAGLLAEAARAPGHLAGFAPVLDAGCRVLVLGSFPSVASLAAGGYYAHPRNRFWPLLAEILGEQGLADAPFEVRYRLALAHGVGIWDVVAHCRRPGSLDSDIRDARWNEFGALRTLAPSLRWVLFNGRAAARREPVLTAAGYRTRVLPSTSPANAGISLEHKRAAWRTALRDALDESGA